MKALRAVRAKGGRRFKEGLNLLLRTGLLGSQAGTVGVPIRDSQDLLGT